ncbi:MAG: hypothetical protein J6W56_06130 [Prevotella sp.]|nr:hypothetical protein [Prevotella sp.]
MKRFIYKILLFLFAFIAINALLQFSIPKDKNGYHCEYNHKVELLEKTPSPRIIFIGGSNIPFGINSKTLKDSLHIDIVNFGLHAGIGIRYPLVDYLDYARKGDIAVIQMEYANYFTGGNGEPESLLPLMVATNWRNVGRLNFYQWRNILVGVPQVTVLNLKRVLNYTTTKSFDTPSENEIFAYVKSGFNELGDEVGHFKYPNIVEPPLRKVEDRTVDSGFMVWLADMIQQYEQRGAKVVMLPPVCINTHFKTLYNSGISEALDKIHHPYIVDPHDMVLDDSCAFNSGYHMNSEGIRQNTSNIIKIFKEKGLLRE